MRIPVQTKVRGMMRCVVLDEFGNVERGRDGVPVARDASGFLRRVGEWAPNLVTNRGLDQIADEGWYSGADQRVGIRKVLHVGSGSGAPANGDVSLASQIGTTQSDGGFSAATEQVSTDATNLIAQGRRTLVYTAGSNVNLAEYGFSPDGVASNLGVRELFRDGVGTPITISLLSGKSLRLEHVGQFLVPLEQTVPVDVDEYDVGGSLVQTRTFSAKVWPMVQSGLYAQYLEPQRGPAGAAATDAVWSTAPTPTGGSGVQLGGNIAGGSDSLLAYTPGTYQRSWRLRLAPSAGNGLDLATWVTYASGTTFISGYMLALQNGTHPKVSTHQLDVFLDLSWARA